MKLGELEQAKSLAILDNIRPYLEADIKKLIEALENRTYMELEQGKLTPERALNAWIEKNTYRKLLSRYSQRMEVARQAATGVAKMLDNPGINT